MFFVYTAETLKVPPFATVILYLVPSGDLSIKPCVESVISTYPLSTFVIPDTCNGTLGVCSFTPTTPRNTDLGIEEEFTRVKKLENFINNLDDQAYREKCFIVHRMRGTGS